MSLSELVEKIDSCEPKNRPTISEKLSAALQIESPTYEESSRLVTGLADWLKANNFKVSYLSFGLQLTISDCFGLFNAYFTFGFPGLRLRNQRRVGF